MDGRAPEFAGAAVINVELDSDNNISNDLPPWVRDAIERALGETGIQIGKKLASEEVIEHLEEIDFDKIADDNKDCPICYDTYKRTARSERRNNVKGNIAGVEMKQLQGLLFNDPSLFFPLIESSTVHSRFPPRCLVNLNEPTIEEVLPGYESLQSRKEKNKKKNKNKKDDLDEHIPVKMPGCNHIFGKSCLIEWLNNNVSCPLCRKEVESQSKDPKAVKRNEIRSNINTNFQNEGDEEGEGVLEDMITHIADRLTNVFHPFKRPFNPRVTPLTDSYMPQEWSKPKHAWKQEHEQKLLNDSVSKRTSDPELILPKKFPVPDFTSLPLRRGLNNLTTPGATTTTNTNNVNNADNTGGLGDNGFFRHYSLQFRL